MQGILTKPDGVQEKIRADELESTMCGEHFEAGFGYYVIRDSPDLAVSRANARKEEAVFFDTVEPYASKLAGYKNRFGTFNLLTALSRRFALEILTGYSAPVLSPVLFSASSFRPWQLTHP